MAKGHQRSNREARKPKMEKRTEKVESPPGSAIKRLDAGTTPRKSGKSR
jgi:hypothetical protein